MKSFVKFTALALVLTMAACTRVDEWDNTPYQPEPVIPEPEAPGMIEFTANVATKTALDEATGTVTWVLGDEVLFVWEGGSSVAAAKKSGEETKFKVQIPEGIDKLYVVYPATQEAIVANGQMVLGFAKELEGTGFDGADVSVSSSVMTDGEWNTTLNFKKVASLVKVGVVDELVTSLQVSVPGAKIAGKLPVSLDNNADLVFGTPTETESTITMAVPAAGVYWVPMLPGVDLTQGMTVTLHKSDVLSDTLKSDSEITSLDRGDIISFSQPEVFTGKFYVSPAGAGSKTGLSVLNPMDAATFAAMVTDPSRIAEFNGKVFSFSANTFSFGDDYITFDYPDYEGTVEIILEGTVSGNAQTVFNGRSNTSESNKAGVFWPRHNASLTVKNVKFTKTDGKSNASVIRVNSGAVAVTLENCTFDNNKTAGSGAALVVYTGTAVNMKDCTFTNNTGDGNAIVVESDAATVKMENCFVKGCTKNVIWIKKAKSFEILDSEFTGNTVSVIYSQNVGTFNAERTIWKNNHAKDDSGTAAFMEGAGQYTFKDCQFIGNNADWRGGALCASGSESTLSVKIEDCLFDSNSTDAVDATSDTKYYGGSAIQITAPVTVDINNAQFLNNYSNLATLTAPGGAIFAYADGAVVRCNNCLFDGNYCYRSKSDNSPCGAIAVVRKKAKLYFNGCEFKENATGTYEGTGARYGMLMSMHAGGTIAMNNCYLHDNYGGRNADGLDWIFYDNAEASLIISNTTIIGDPMRKVSAESDPVVPSADGSTPKKGVIHLRQDANYHFLNNIMCSPTDGKAIYFETSISVEGAMYNKTSPVNENANWGTDTGSGHDYYGTASYFAGLNGYMWDGTMTGTNSNVFAPTADVNAAIQTADADFHSWLQNVGALGTDINGNSRGTTSWPGCYQN